MTFPEPVIEVKIEPKTKADQDKLALALQRLSRRIDLPRPHRPGVLGDPHRGHGRAAPRRPRRSDGPRVQGRGQHRQAPGLLPRDHPARRGGQRPLRPPDRRQGEAQYGHAVIKLEPAEKGRGLRVRRQDRRRDHPARVHQVGRRGHPREARDRHLRRLPGGRRQGDPVRRSYHDVDSSRWPSRSPVRWPSRMPSPRPTRPSSSRS